MDKLSFRDAVETKQTLPPGHSTQFFPPNGFFSGEMAGFGEIYGCVFASVYNVLSGAGGEDKVPGNRI